MGQHGKAKRMSLAIAGDADANAILDGEARYALQRSHAKSVAQKLDDGSMHVQHLPNGASGWGSEPISYTGRRELHLGGRTPVSLWMPSLHSAEALCSSPRL